MSKKQKWICWLGAINILIYGHLYHESKKQDIFGARTVVIYNIEAEAPKPAQNPAEATNLTLATIQGVAKDENMDWKILYAICEEESRGCKSQHEIGDGGDSWGWFQINHPAHPEITRDEAYDLAWSARWTAERLKHYAEQGGWDYAIRKHNGNADLNFGKWAASYQATYAYLGRVKNNILNL